MNVRYASSPCQVEIKRVTKPVVEKLSVMVAFILLENVGGIGLSAFCRTPPARSYTEENKRLKKLMSKGNAEAFNFLASLYARGINGLPQDEAKANKLFLKAGELGCAVAYYNLANA